MVALPGPPAPDLTDATWDYGSTDGEIFGDSRPPEGHGGYAERLKDTDIGTSSLRPTRGQKLKARNKIAGASGARTQNTKEARPSCGGSRVSQ
jgi:hypothetical protein